MKTNVVLLLVLVVMTSSLVARIPSTSASVSKPSVPEFTLKFVDYSFDVPPTYGIDQFTGNTVIKVQGEHIDNRSVVFTIRNQPFTPYVDSSNNTIGLYYNFRFKGHFGSDWSYYPFLESGQSARRYGSTFIVFIDQSPDKLSASYSEYTDIVMRLPFLFGYGNPPMGTQADFQVQALMGHIDYEGDGFYSYTGERSDWSVTRTITIGQNDSTTTPNTLPPQDSTTTPNQPADQSQNSTPASTDQPDSQNAFPFILDWEQLAIVTLLVVVGIMSVVILYLHRRSTKRTP
jgi:hypothetical protein